MGRQIRTQVMLFKRRVMINEHGPIRTAPDERTRSVTRRGLRPRTAYPDGETLGANPRRVHGNRGLGTKRPGNLVMGVCPLRLVAATTILTILPALARALDDGHWQKADHAIKRGVNYLRQTQNEDGSWSPQPGPAITAMVLTVMLDKPDISTKDPAIAKALEFVLSKRKPEGGIHNGILQNYNTAICLSALAHIHDRADVAEAVAEGQHFLRKLQWHNQIDSKGVRVSPSHPFYGGAGYGKHGRPDLSNTQVMLQGLHDSGLTSDAPAFQRALVFITRCQGTTANKMFCDKIVQDGGFIYATSMDRNHIDIPQSMASPDTAKAVLRGYPVTRLRTYGSMTYAGFKSYVYADLRRDDQRVVDAHNWIRRNYTIAHNPGMPEARKWQGYFYYLMTMSRALDAWGSTHIESPDGFKHDWKNDLIGQIVDLQRPDGSWVNQSSRWMEKDPNLVTAYALIALSHAIK